MADSGAAAAQPAPRIKTVRSQKIIPDPSSPEIPLKSVITATTKAVEKDGDAESEDDEPVPLPQSQTLGHAAGRSAAKNRRRNLSDLPTRERSNSASQTLSTGAKPSDSTAVTQVPTQAAQKSVPTQKEQQQQQQPPPPPPPPPPSASTTATDPVPSRGDGASKDARKHTSRPAPAVVGSSSRATLSASTTNSRPAPIRVTRPPRGQHTPFPPMLDPKDAPDVQPAPASGMYWSKAMVSGAPHPNLRAHSATLIGSNIYVFGGWDSRTCFNNLFVLDADAFYWSVPHVQGEMPNPLRAMTCTAVGKKIVVFGGGDGPTYHNAVHVLDTLSYRWTKPRILSERVPCARRAHVACLYKNAIYVFGGGDGDKALNDIWRLDVGDMTKMSWKLISGGPNHDHRSRSGGVGSTSATTTTGASDHGPRARGYHSGNMCGSKLIIYGGSDGAECFDDVWIYDVETHVWKAVNVSINSISGISGITTSSGSSGRSSSHSNSNTSFRRLAHSATLVGSYLFVIGGHDGDEYCNDVLLLNLVTMAWDRRRVYGKPLSERGYHATVLHDGRLLVIGGFDGTEVYGDVTILELAVHAYYPQISHFTIDV